MVNKDMIKVPLTHYVFGVLLSLCMAALALIPSAMVYRLRVFDEMSLPDWLYQTANVVIFIAVPFSVFMTGLVRTFSVSGQKHADALKVALFLEGLACVLEIFASLIVGTDIWSRGGQAITLGGAIAAAFGALGYAVTQSDFYRAVIMQRERTVMWNDSVNETFGQVLQSDGIQREIERAAVIYVQDQIEKMTGRRLYSREIPQTRGVGHSPPSVTQDTESAEEIETLTERSTLQKIADIMSSRNGSGTHVRASGDGRTGGAPEPPFGHA